MLLTIFTPTYNRAETLMRTFKSLCTQEQRDFEWLVVDDGSTDGTRLLMEKFIAEAKFPVRYHYREHGGKHRAYNDALTLARGDYFFAVDSDDWLPDGAIDLITKLLPLEDEMVCGIVALKEDTFGCIYGERLKSAGRITTLQELEECGNKGEHSYIFKTDIARQYLFPTIEGEVFVTESVIYDRIGADWKFYILDKPLTVCEYQQDGLSRNIYQLMWNNPVGFIIYHSQRISQARNLSIAFRHALRYHAFRHIANSRAFSEKYIGRYRILVKLTACFGPVGRLFYKYKCITKAPEP